MIRTIQHKHSTLAYRVFSAFIAFTFIFSIIIPPRLAQAQSVLNLPQPGTMIPLSVSYNPAIVAGITIYPDDPLKFDFIIDVGDDHLKGEALRKESEKLISYFMATLTVPEDEMWVNLSPYEKDRIIADGLGNTVMGRDMLAQDYLLKQLTASLMYPEDELGNEFWQRVYKKAQEKFGTTEIPTNTFNKIWIVPEEAVIYTNGTNIFVADSCLKVMMEEDYLALEYYDKGLDANADDMDMTKEAKTILKEVLLPEIEKEVNEGKNFATLRQIYHSMILATWYKNNLKESLLGQVYVNQNKTNGVDVEDKDIKNKIYNQYIEAFKKGVYNYIREDYDSVTQEVIPRKYFSGGFDAIQLASSAISNTDGVSSKDWLSERSSSPMVTVETEVRLNSSSPVSSHTDMLSSPDIKEPEGIVRFSTSKANYVFYPSVHLEFQIPDDIVAKADAVVLETPGYMDYGGKHKNFKILIDKNFHKNKSKYQKPPITFYKQLIQHQKRSYLLDLPSSPFIKKSGILGLFLLVIPLLPHFIIMQKILSKNKDPSSVIEAVKNHNLLNTILSVFIPLAGYKSAVISEKIIEDVVPRLQRRLKRKPTILIQYGAAHLDMMYYLRNKWLRNFVISLHYISRFVFFDMNYIKKVGEAKLDEGSFTIEIHNLGEDNKDTLDNRGGSSPIVSQGKEEKPGGIDFNPNNLNLKEQGQAIDINFTNIPNIQPDTVNGVTPVIINITPVVNFPLLLGESEEQSDDFSLSQLNHKGHSIKVTDTFNLEGFE